MKYTPPRLGGHRATSARNHPRYGDPIEHYRRPQFYTLHKLVTLVLLALSIFGTLAAIVGMGH